MRGVIIGTLLAITIATSACMLDRPESVQAEEVSSAKPVTVPYLGVNIRDIPRTESHQINENRAVLRCLGEAEQIIAEDTNGEYDAISDESQEGTATDMCAPDASVPETSDDADGFARECDSSEPSDCGDSEDGGTVDAESEEEREEPESTEPQETYTYIGEWVCTGYCPNSCCCGEWATGCTASGVLATSNHTVACNSLPFGTQLLIDGIIYTVEDTGWSPYGDEWLDIFFDTHDEALAFGLQTKEVYLVG